MVEFRSGLLVINGFGNHPPPQTLEAIVEPLLARMRAEGVLVDAVATQLGDKDQAGGQLDAIEVDYRLSPVNEDSSTADEPRRLLVVEVAGRASTARPTSQRCQPARLQGYTP